MLRLDDVKTQMAGQGLDLAGGSPQRFLDVIRRDAEKWKKVVKEIKLTVAS